jgi:hypothetical protein
MLFFGEISFSAVFEKTHVGSQVAKFLRKIESVIPYLSLLGLGLVGEHTVLYL